MSLYDVAMYVSVALLIAAMFYLPRKVSARSLLRVGFVLFVVGWTGVFVTVGISDLPVLQSEAVAYTLMGSFFLAIVVGGLFLVTAFFEWLGLARPRRQRRQFPPFDS